MDVTADILELDVEVNHFIVEMPVCTLNSKVCFFGIKPNSTTHLKRCLKWSESYSSIILQGGSILEFLYLKKKTRSYL